MITNNWVKYLRFRLAKVAGCATEVAGCATELYEGYGCAPAPALYALDRCYGSNPYVAWVLRKPGYLLEGKLERAIFKGWEAQRPSKRVECFLRKELASRTSSGKG